MAGYGTSQDQCPILSLNSQSVSLGRNSLTCLKCVANFSYATNSISFNRTIHLLYVRQVLKHFAGLEPSSALQRAPSLIDCLIHHIRRILGILCNSYRREQILPKMLKKEKE